MKDNEDKENNNSTIKWKWKLPKQACEQSDSDALLQIVHKMPCTRHLSRKEKTKLMSIISQFRESDG